MSDRFTQILVRTTTGFLIALMASGCQKASVPNMPGMVQVRGEITVNGTPVPVGRVVYVPKQPSDAIPGGQFASAVTNGKYSLELPPGAYRVEIHQYEESPIDQVSQLLPKKFNTESTLTADVTGTNSNQIDFSLQSDTK